MIKYKNNGCDKNMKTKIIGMSLVFLLIMPMVSITNSTKIEENQEANFSIITVEENEQTKNPRDPPIFYREFPQWGDTYKPECERKLSKGQRKFCLNAFEEIYEMLQTSLKSYYRGYTMQGAFLELLFVLLFVHAIFFMQCYCIGPYVAPLYSVYKDEIKKIGEGSKEDTINLMNIFNTNIMQKINNFENCDICA